MSTKLATVAKAPSLEAEAVVTDEVKLRAVLNTIIAHHGNVKLTVTRQRQAACLPHSLATSTPFDEKTAYRGPNGLWMLIIRSTMCSPVEGEVLFSRWINGEHALIPHLTGKDESKLAQPKGDYCRWN